MDAGCFAAGYPDITLSISDNYADMNGDGQKHGSFWIHAMLCSDALENLVTDATVKRFAEFTSGLMRIRYRDIPEINAIVLGHDAILREQLKKTDISPFCNLSQWYSQSYLKGAKLGNDSFGIGFHLCSNGFKTIIWEENENLQKMSNAMNAYPELKAFFPEHEEGNPHWGYGKIFPFDSILDWLKELQRLLVSLQ